MYVSSDSEGSDNKTMDSVASFRVALLGALLFIPALVLGEDHDPEVWIDRMAQAIHQLNYDGTFIYFQDGQMESMRIIHGVDSSGERERLVSLNGPAREVVRDSEQVTCILRDDSVMIDKSGPQRLSAFKLPAQPGSLQGRYRFEMMGEDRIAGHAVRKLAIRPLDRFRYGHRIWLHRDNNLLLRSELLNENGDVVEQLMFTDIRFFDSLPEALLIPRIAEHDVVISQPLPAAVQERVPVEGRWRVDDLPEGFTKQSAHEQIMARSKAKAEHIVFSDGLATISVFVEQQGGQPISFTGASRMGAVNAYSRQFEGYLITVVGEVPALTVRRIADSISLNEPQ